MSILDKTKREEIIRRINQLKPEKDPDLFGRTLIKFLVLYLIPIPKNVPTSPKINQVEGKGTPPTDFESDRKTLLDYLERFSSTPEDFAWTPHFKFGAMNQKEWAILAHKHLHHHLKQFGA